MLNAKFLRLFKLQRQSGKKKYGPGVNPPTHILVVHPDLFIGIFYDKIFFLQAVNAKQKNT
jgi:hypothetical protein